MAEQIRKLGKERLRFCCSSSISNWREKLKNRLQIPEVKYPLFGKVIFFGLYHPIDYLKFIIHRGKKHVFFCGSDIVALKKSRLKWVILLFLRKTWHFCENEVEKKELDDMRIISFITSMIFDDPNIDISFKPSSNPNVWMCVQKGYEYEYGVDYLLEYLSQKVHYVTFHIYGDCKYIGKQRKNVIFHGKVSNNRFNREIKDYQAGIRLNSFDGFSEVLSKSILMGQYPISFYPIKYPYIDYAENDFEGIRLLHDLKNKKEPNYDGVKYWRERLENSLKEILQ